MSVDARYKTNAIKASMAVVMRTRWRLNDSAVANLKRAGDGAGTIAQ